MSLAHGNRPIVTDGLVLCLDAANARSYPGTGTTWNDLSGNGNHGTLVNGVGYSADNKGTLVFDGTNDYSRINAFASDSNLALSVFCWVYANSLTTNQFGGVYYNWIINKRNTNNPSPNCWQLMCTDAFPTVGMWDNNANLIHEDNLIQANNSLSSLEINRWYHVGFVTSGVSGEYLNIYLNGILNYSGTITGNRGIEARPLDIGKAGWVDTFYWDGNISNASIYNRALTADEVAQNFNAMKGRYGL